MSVLPAPTRDPARARADLDSHGLAILAGALDATALATVRARLEDAIAASEADGVPTRGYAFDPDLHNVRVFHLLNLDPLFVDLVRDPRALAFVRHQLGEKFLISNFSANITTPGNAPMLMHADQGYVYPPWGERPLACNVGWLLDDLTDMNGGTRVVPGSHRLDHGPVAGKAYDTVAVEAPAGSLMVMDGRLWHQTGANRTPSGTRAALFGYYVLRWLRPQINWNAALWPETVARLDPPFLHLLGYYTGNTESQIPNGRRAAVSMPAGLDEPGQDFALGYGRG
ncbi:MAG: phytanoyl-CoA dioxygenase family protein [Gammaproteobacteria bacterium]|nr:phytanoyl-CoA dioxygenase family protein [Gammaproteobacteria bacterium]